MQHEITPLGAAWRTVTTTRRRADGHGGTKNQHVSIATARERSSRGVHAPEARPGGSRRASCVNTSQDHATRSVPLRNAILLRVLAKASDFLVQARSNHWINDTWHLRAVHPLCVVV